MIAQMTSALSNRWRGKSEKASQPIDFMPYHEKPEQTPDEIMRMIRGA